MAEPRASWHSAFVIIPLSEKGDKSSKAKLAYSGLGLLSNQILDARGLSVYRARKMIPMQIQLWHHQKISQRSRSQTSV